MKNTAAAPPTYCLTLEPAGGEWGTVPAEVRLRQALKLLLRGYGLRCRSVRRVAWPEAGSPALRPAAAQADTARTGP